MHPTFKFMAQFAAALALAAAAALPARAQGARTATRASSPGRPTAADMVRDESERELMMRELEETGRRDKTERAGPRPAFAQLAEDFTRIQVVNNELVQAAARPEALDLKFVAKSAAEVRKLAQRLKTNLVLPEPGTTPKYARLATEDDQQMKAALKDLGKLIAGFAHNPVFREPNVVDAQMSAKARLDLEEIIDLSGQVSKGSEKLSKAAPKP
ncbi:MAG TPA: hypothetical protein VF546_17680 [Pyrinomonadaceae bacterium]|jgi:uncharacterized protein (DUF58 family)